MNASIRTRLIGAMTERYGHEQNMVIARAPGRVNLIGDHTDYNDGFVLPVTLEEAIYGVAARRRDDTVRVYSLNFEEEICFSLADPIEKGAQWFHFVRGMVGAVHRRAPLPSGFEAALYGAVPIGSGLSSSAAVEVALLMLVQELYGLSMDPIESALLCQRVEHEVIGLQCGIMDQFASRLGKSRHALFLDCRTLKYEEIPMNLGPVSLLVVDSIMPRSLASSKYNERRGECERGVLYFQTIDAGVRALRDVSPEVFESHKRALSEPVRRRCEHVIYENERVQRAARALETGDVHRLGDLMDASHESLRTLYEVSCEEVDLLVREAQRSEGVYGARITGAGFGGCMVSLVDGDSMGPLKDRLRSAYRSSVGLEPAFYEVRDNLEARAGRV